MTVEELIVYNSTIPAGQGTVLEHLQNIQVARTAIDTISVNTTGKLITVDILDNTITADVVADIITSNVQPDVITIDFDDVEIGVNI